MLRRSLAASLLYGALASVLATAALADNTPRPAVISVVANGSVDYTPDTARMTVGIRADSPNASTAIETINKNSAQVIAALKSAGVSDAGIKTAGYNLQYRQQPGAPATTGAAALAAANNGYYEASEMLQVTTSIAIAGKALDAAMGAGANEAFGLSYQTSNYDSLYRTALGKAMASALSIAQAIAKAAHVKIVEIQSISNSAEAQAFPKALAMSPMSAGASVVPGTDSVTATVYVVYRIR